MRKYFIQHKVSTLAEMSALISGSYNKNPEIIIDGFKITQVNQDFYDSMKTENFWIIEKEISAENWIQARNDFKNKFFPIANKLGFISQCYFNFLGESYIIKKLSNNPRRIFYYYDVNHVDPVGLVFSKNELDCYVNLAKFKNNPILDLAFIYLQVSNNTVGWHARIMLLFAALEALAGKSEKLDKDGVEYTSYNKSEMIKILGSKNFNDLFGNGGLRHKIDHGDDISSFFLKMSEEGIDYLAVIYNKIIIYINSIYNISINTNIILPQRHPFGNIEYSGNFYIPNKINIQINLLDCVNLDEKNGYELINFNPKNY